MRHNRPTKDRIRPSHSFQSGHAVAVRSPRKWFYDLLSKGEPPRVNENDIVEAGYVSLTEGPMVMARLHEAGLRAASAETRVNPYVSASMTRIMCRAGDLQAARRVIDDVTSV
jgi:hypothetical protein